MNRKRPVTLPLSLTMGPSEKDKTAVQPIGSWGHGSHDQTVMMRGGGGGLSMHQLQSEGLRGANTTQNKPSRAAKRQNDVFVSTDRTRRVGRFTTLNRMIIL